jgi:hypothetical protein
MNSLLASVLGRVHCRQNYFSHISRTTLYLTYGHDLINSPERAYQIIGFYQVQYYL